MSRRSVAVLFPWLLPCAAFAAVAWMAGCRSSDPSRSDKPESQPDLKANVIDYVDSDAFDALFENALVNQDPVVVVRTTHEAADWGPRLNAWIAAWNRGGRSRVKTARGQSPAVPKVGIDGDSVREFRLLVESLIGRVEEAADAGSTWYQNQRERARRVGLLKPYSLRFHKGEDGTIQLIYFHEQYSAYYPRFVQQLTDGEARGDEWARTVECSQCSLRR